MRIRRLPGGGKEWYLLKRLKCTGADCGRMHIELPDFLVPFKHYGADVIEGVIDGRISSEDIETEDYPCEGTMKHWKWWFLHNRENIEGQIRSRAYDILELGDEFLKSTVLLLDELRRRISDGWLKIVISFIYNAGGRIEPNPA